MRNYQRKHNNPFQLPHNVYMQCLYAIRDYDRLKKEMDDVLYAYPTPDGQPRGSDISDVTASKAIRIETISRRCEAVEQALVHVPLEYRKGIMDNIMYGAGYPNDADPETYRRWRRRFIYHIAENKYML